MESFDRICKKNYERIYKYILGMTGNAEVAKDLTQDAFLIAYQKGKEFLTHEKPEGFLYKTAKNLVLVNYRNRQREILFDNQEDFRIQREDIFEEICKSRETAISIDLYRKEILEQLSPKKKQLYDLYYVENKSMKEIARELGAGEVALRMRYVRLRKEISTQVRTLHLGDF